MSVVLPEPLQPQTASTGAEKLGESVWIVSTGGGWYTNLHEGKGKSRTWGAAFGLYVVIDQFLGPSLIRWRLRKSTLSWWKCNRLWDIRMPWRTLG